MKLSHFGYLLVALVLFSCTNGKKTEQNQTLQFGVMASMDYVPVAVAKAKGYFEAEGVEVNLQKFFSANDRDAAIQSGNLDGSIIDYTGAAIQKAGGVQLFFTSQCDGTFELIAGKHLQAASDNVLEGKNFAIARNTVIDFCTDMVLKNANINQNQVTKSEINKIPLRLEMLRNEKIDLTVLPDPFATMAKADGKKAITSMKEMGLHVTGIVFMQSALENKKSAIQAFYRAYNRAITDLQQLPISDFRDILIAEIGFPEQLADQVQLPDYQPAKVPQATDLQIVSEWLKEKNLVPAEFDITTITNADFIP